MKSKIYEASNLAVIIVGTLCIVAMITLVLLALAGLISAGWFILGMILDTLVMTLVSMYIEAHFVDGEWV